MEKSDKLSVFISLVLRHKPEVAGICLDEHGWADVDELLKGINNTGRTIDMEAAAISVSWYGRAVPGCHYGRRIKVHEPIICSLV